MSTPRQLVDRYGVDALVVLAACAGALGTLLRDDAAAPDGVRLWAEAAAIAGVVLLLLLRLAHPFGAPATMWVGAAALSFLDEQLVINQPAVFLAGMAGALMLGNVRSDRDARAGLVIVLAGAGVVVYNDPTHQTGDLIATPVQFGIAWMVGYVLRERTQRTEAAEERAVRAERDRATAARIAVAEERARIARELHDVVAHAMSVMVLQVGAVRHRMAQADPNRDALENVERAGRSALSEMRRLLGAMRKDDEPAELSPHPGLADLDSLVSDVRAAGLPVTLEVEGEKMELPSGLDLSAYRIVQEALTNSLKHAQARHAEVHVCYDGRAVEVQVHDDGSGRGSHDALGHGLVGIRERVKIFGGEMSAGPGPGRGFTVWARLPVDGAAS